MKGPFFKKFPPDYICFSKEAERHKTKKVVANPEYADVLRWCDKVTSNNGKKMGAISKIKHDISYYPNKFKAIECVNEIISLPTKYTYCKLTFDKVSIILKTSFKISCSVRTLRRYWDEIEENLKMKGVEKPKPWHGSWEIKQPQEVLSEANKAIYEIIKDCEQLNSYDQEVKQSGIFSIYSIAPDLQIKQVEYQTRTSIDGKTLFDIDHDTLIESDTSLTKLKREDGTILIFGDKALKDYLETEAYNDYIKTKS